MKRATWLPAILILAMLLPGCREDRDNPTPTTEGDRVMESYLANVQKIGNLLAEVRSESEAQAVAPEVLLIVEDMRRLQPRMEAIDDEAQADTMSKYRVKINNVNEQFTEDIVHFVNIPGASEDLIEQLKNLPTVGP